MILRSADCTRQIFGDGSKGALFLADSAELPQTLLDAYWGKVNLVYFDPPFFTGQEFYYKPRTDVNQRFKLYADKWESLDAYLQMIRKALTAAYECLADNGVIYVHVDYRVAADIKLLLDEIFGRKHFVNEIIWNYKSGGSSRKHFPRKHDTIFFYSKGSVDRVLFLKLDRRIFV